MQPSRRSSIIALAMLAGFATTQEPPPEAYLYLYNIGLAQREIEAGRTARPSRCSFRRFETWTLKPAPPML